MRIVSYNCRSLNARLSEFKLFLYVEKPHCVCLTETWLNETAVPNFINYTAYWNHRLTARGGGIGILIRSDIVVIPSPLAKFNNNLEIQKLTIKLKNKHLDIMNVYNTSPDLSFDVINRYFSQLGKYSIVVGDFNAHHPNWSLINAKTNVVGKSLVQWLQTRNDFALASPPRLITYVHPANGAQSVLDLCFCTVNLLPLINIIQGESLGSDHFALKINLEVETHFQPIKIRQKLITKGVGMDQWKCGLPTLESNHVSDINTD